MEPPKNLYLIGRGFSDNVLETLYRNAKHTAVLFDLRDAESVIDIELYPSLFKKALMNMRINRLEDRIILLECGCFEC